VFKGTDWGQIYTKGLNTTPAAATPSVRGSPRQISVQAHPASINPASGCL